MTKISYNFPNNHRSRTMNRKYLRRHRLLLRFNKKTNLCEYIHSLIQGNSSGVVSVLVK